MIWQESAPNENQEIWNTKSKEGHRHTIKKIGNDEIEKLFIPFNTSWNKDIFSFLKDIVHHIHKLLKKERFENEEIENNFAKHSARELLTVGKTFYMNPCLDFVLVTIEWLKRTGIENIQFIVEELQCPWHWFKLHFGIELKRQGKNYYIDYREKNNVFLWEGSFISKYKNKWEEIVHSIRADAKDISVDDNIYTLMEKKIITFKKFDPKLLDILKERLKRHNSPEERKRWFVEKVKNIHEPEIFLETNAKK